MSLSYTRAGEPIEVAVISKEVTGGFTINSVLELVNYQYYDDLWHRKLGTPKLNITGKRTTLTFEREDPVGELGTITFQFRINNFMKNIERYPATFLTEFATIGGIVALFQLGVVLRWLHQILFEKNLQEAIKLHENSEAAKSSK